MKKVGRKGEGRGGRARVRTRQRERDSGRAKERGGYGARVYTPGV